MGKQRHDTKPPREGSLAAFVHERKTADPDLTVAEIHTQALAAGYADATHRRVYHALWYYGLLTKEPKLKPLVTAATAQPVPDELVRMVLKHGTAATRAVVDAIDQHQAATSKQVSKESA